VSSILQYLPAIAGLALLIVVHEFGHFIVARLCGMRVERFSVGFGKPLVKFKRGDTIFQLAPIPLGGFVQITGLNPYEEFDRDDPYVYPNRPRWMQLAVLVAGPAANYITAIGLAILVISSIGAPTDRIQVSGVLEDSPAAAAGFQPGDVFETANAEPITAQRPITALVAEAKDNPMHVTVERDGKAIHLTVTPSWDEDRQVFLMGVGLQAVLTPVPLGEAIRQGVVKPFTMTGHMLKGLWNMITFKEKADVKGPVGIAQMLKSALDEGFISFVSLIMALSVYLGMFNMLPFPALDGGRVVFVALQSLGLKNISAKTEAVVHMVGLVLLLGVFVLVTFKDIVNLGQ